MYELMVRDHFAAAHRLRGHSGKCENQHGHNWTVEAEVRAEELDEMGLVLDFADMKQALALVMDELDHKDINELEAFSVVNPSSENLARHVFERLEAQLAGQSVQVIAVHIWESRDCRATYRTTV